MISKSIGLALWVLCTIALYIMDYLFVNRDGAEDDEEFTEVVGYWLGALAIISTIGLIIWLMTGGLGI